MCFRAAAVTSLSARAVPSGSLISRRLLGFTSRHTYVWKKLRFVSSRWPIKGPGSLTKRIIRKRWQRRPSDGRRDVLHVHLALFELRFFFLSVFFFSFFFFSFSAWQGIAAVPRSTRKEEGSRRKNERKERRERGKQERDEKFALS